MKQLHFVGKQKKPATFSLVSLEAQKALTHADFHCQICYSPKSLKVYARIDTFAFVKPGDLTVLCESCYELASSQKRKRRYGNLARMFHLVCLIMVSTLLVLFFGVLTTRLSQPLLWLYVISLYTVLLLVALFRRWF